MLDLLISLGWGTFSFTREKAENLVDMLIAKGEISREEAKNTINALLARGEKEREEARQYLKTEINSIMQKFNFCTRDEILALQEKIRLLEAKIDQNDGNNGENN